jgi:hypothetical protein
VRTSVRSSARLPSQIIRHALIKPTWGIKTRGNCLRIVWCDSYTQGPIKELRWPSKNSKRGALRIVFLGRSANCSSLLQSPSATTAFCSFNIFHSFVLIRRRVLKKNSCVYFGANRAKRGITYSGEARAFLLAFMQLRHIHALHAHSFNYNLLPLPRTFPAPSHFSRALAFFITLFHLLFFHRS